MKRKVGRPRISEKCQERRNISLSPKMAEKARSIGEGNVSEGIRIAIEHFRSPESARTGKTNPD